MPEQATFDLAKIRDSGLRAYVLCGFAEKNSIYSWLDQCPLPVSIVDQYVGDWVLPEDAGIVITHMHYQFEGISALRRIHQQNRVPVLVLADGILEYRNTWEHPELADGSIFQPLCGHKLACISRGQARVVESWGNVGKCEVIGMPRIDSVDLSAVPPIQTEGPFRLLIATATTPAFNEAQRTAVVTSLTHIRERLQTNDRVNGRIAQVTWRLTDGLEKEIGLPESEWNVAPAQRQPLSEVIDNSDAVVTTPSTLYLESILRRRPTAILDFHNRPHYVSAAWTINAPIHFNWTMRELANPPGPKLLFQDATLYDQLECHTPATPRMIQLVSGMVSALIRSRETGQPLSLDHRIVADEQHGLSRVPDSFDLQKLYPDNDVFSKSDTQRLQVELNAAIRRLDQLPEELAEKNALVANLIKSLNQARLRAEDMHKRTVDMHKRLIDIRNRFGIKPGKSNVEPTKPNVEPDMPTVAPPTNDDRAEI